MRTTAMFLFAVGMAVAAPVPKSLRVKSDAELLQGQWRFVSLDGGEGPQKNRGYLVVSDGKLDMNSEDAVPIAEHPFTLDSTTFPKRLDIAWKGWKSPQQYIYHLDGDTLTICHAQPQQSRPTELKGGNGQYCFVLKRVKE